MTWSPRRGHHLLLLRARRHETFHRRRPRGTEGLFVLVRTSNESAGVIQNTKLESGLTVAELIAQQVAEWARGEAL